MNQINITCKCNKCNNTWEEITDLSLDELYFDNDELAYHLLGKFQDNRKLLEFLIAYNVIPSSDYCWESVEIYKKFLPLYSLEDELKIELLSKMYKKYALNELERLIEG